MTLLAGTAASADAASGPGSTPDVPRAFRGEWDTRLSDCRASPHQGWMRVTRNTVDLFDATGLRVVGVDRHGTDNVTLSLARDDNGRPHVERRRLRLVNAGHGIVDYVGKRTRFRCPGR